jgi:hypothetical protein
MTVSPRKQLCIGMAAYDDYDGVYFSAMAIRLYHPEIAAETEILVIDNHPRGPSSAGLKALEKSIQGYRYVPFDQIGGTAVRDMVFREAHSEFVLCIDCHVMFAPGSLRLLLDYFHAHPDTPDLLQGPLLHDDMRTLSTHMEPRWSCGMYGVWGSDRRAADPAAPPFEITMHGLGGFACRKAAWPGLNPRLRGFGGEEGYLHEKFRRAGGRALCLPFLRWVHRFGRPAGVPYRNSWEDRIRNYLVIADELGLDPAEAVDHFRAHVGAEAADPIVAAAHKELASPFHFFDAIYCINRAASAERWRDVSEQFSSLGIAHRVRRFEAASTPHDSYAGSGLSHRALIADARRQGLGNLLVLEDEVRFNADTMPRLRLAVNELRDRPWQIVHLREHAVAYHSSVYDRILGRSAPIGRAAGAHSLFECQRATAEGVVGFDAGEDQREIETIGRDPLRWQAISMRARHIPLAVEDGGPRTPGLGCIEQAPAAGVVVGDGQQIAADSGIVDCIDAPAVGRIPEDRAGAGNLGSP